jgi:ABC-type arginine transport system permease subunit
MLLFFWRIALPEKKETMEAACKNLALVSLLHNITTVKVSKNI